MGTSPDVILSKVNKTIFLIRATTSAERYCNEEQKWWSQPAGYSKLSPGGPIPHNMAKTFDGPPTLERSGSEHRRAVTSFLSEKERLG